MGNFVYGPHTLNPMNDALSYTGTASQGGTITIITDGTYDFGATGPTLSYRMPISSMVDGSPIPLTNSGAATVTNNAFGPPIVEDVVAMPRGKAIQIGAEDSVDNSTDYRQLKMVDPAVELEFFEHYYWYFPTANQVAAAPELDGAATWQQKCFWEFVDTDGTSSGTKSDGFHGTPLWNAGGLYWTSGNAFSTNMTSQTITGNGSGITNPGNNATVRDTPCSRQMWIKCDPILSGTVSSGFCETIESGTGDQTTTDLSGNNLGGTATTGYDRANLPGFSRGHNIPLGAHTLIGDVYRTYGAGAAARVEIHDAELDANVTKKAICNIVTWVDDELVLTVDEGIFYQEVSLSGKFFAIYDSTSTLIAKIVI